MHVNPLNSKISNIANTESNFENTIEVGFCKKTSELMMLETRKPWFCSITGTSPAYATLLTCTPDSQSDGLSVLKPRHNDYDIVFNPLVVDGPGGSTVGKDYAPAANTFAHMTNVDKKSPTIVAFRVQHPPGWIPPQAPINSATASDTSIAGKLTGGALQGPIGPLNPNDPSLTKTPISSSTVTNTSLSKSTEEKEDALLRQLYKLKDKGDESAIEKINKQIMDLEAKDDAGRSSSMNSTVAFIRSHMHDIDHKGKKTPTQDNGKNYNGNSIRAGVHLVDPTYLRALNIRKAERSIILSQNDELSKVEGRGKAILGDFGG